MLNKSEPNLVIELRNVCKSSDIIVVLDETPSSLDADGMQNITVILDRRIIEHIPSRRKFLSSKLLFLDKIVKQDRRIRICIFWHLSASVDFSDTTAKLSQLLQGKQILHVNINKAWFPERHEISELSKLHVIYSLNVHSAKQFCFHN